MAEILSAPGFLNSEDERKFVLNIQKFIVIHLLIKRCKSLDFYSLLVLDS
jgi:hypothetical protein